MERFIFNQLIVDSGKDAMSRPILSVYCCHLPDPEITDYDQLLELSLKRLNRIVAQEYILVVFTNPINHHPPLGWMLQAYQSLKRDYKKNIKQLIIVHPSWWFKLLVGFMKHVVSSKFAKKITNIDSIEELESVITTEEMMIPGDIRSYDHEENRERFSDKEIDTARQIMASDALPAVFGVALSVSCPDGSYPDEIEALIEHIKNKGLRSDSIFRRSPNAEALARLRDDMNKHASINFDDYDMYTLACALKAYLRELPEPLLDRSTYGKFAEMDDIDDADLPSFVARSFVKPLDDRRKKLLKDVMLLSAMTTQLCGVNRMGVRALAVVWTPNLVRHELLQDDFHNLSQSHRVMECMIRDYDAIFCQGNKIW